MNDSLDQLCIDSLQPGLACDHWLGCRGDRCRAASRAVGNVKAFADPMPSWDLFDVQSQSYRDELLLNNLVEQDHRAIKRMTRPMLGFKSFWSAHRLFRYFD